MVSLENSYFVICGGLISWKLKKAVEKSRRESRRQVCAELVTIRGVREYEGTLGLLINYKQSWDQNFIWSSASKKVLGIVSQAHDLSKMLIRNDMDCVLSLCDNRDSTVLYLAHFEVDGGDSVGGVFLGTPVTYLIIE